MSKKTSIVLLSIIMAVVLFFGVVAILPDEIELGNAADEYHAPINLIQRGQLMSNTAWATYKIDEGDLTEEEVSAATPEAQKILSKRFASVYSYYDVPVTVTENGLLLFEIPETSAYNVTEAQDIIDSVAIRGLLEICPSETYNEEEVFFSNNSETKLIKSAKTSHYVNGANEWFIVEVNLTEEGKKVAAKNFTASSGTSISGYCAIDGTVSYQVLYSASSSGSFQIYTYNMVQAKAVASFINGGCIAFNISQVDFGIKETTNLSAVFGWVFLALVVAAAVYFVVRYGVMGIAGAISILAAATALVYVSALLYFVLLNVYAVIGFVIGFAAMFYLTDLVLAKVKNNLADGKSAKVAVDRAFNSSWKVTLIVVLAVLVVGIVCWLIPTAVTTSLGNALVYTMIASAAVAFGTNRLFALMASKIID